MRLIRILLVVACGMALAACGANLATQPPPSPTTGSAAPSQPPATASPAPSPTGPPELMLVAVGDSIPFNSPEDCPGCTGFVGQYADELAAASGKSVGVRNLSQHTGLTVEQLLAELESDQNRIDALANADAIIVGIAHNDVPMNRDDDSCDGAGGEEPDWSKFTDACLATELARFKPAYEGVYSKIAELRAGKPTILLTINRYNDWIGWPAHPPPAEGVEATARVIAAWNEMLCSVAEASGFHCGDISIVFNGPDGTLPAGDLLATDYTHPSQKGNDAILGVLAAFGFLSLFQ
jgi:lysophospholipase L1-like esterase